MSPFGTGANASGNWLLGHYVSGVGLLQPVNFDWGPGLQAVHDLAPSTGFSVYFPPGDHHFATGVNFTKPCRLYGGGSGVQISRIYTENPNLDIITTTSTFAVENLLFQQTNGAAGTSRAIVSSGTVPTPLVRDCRFRGFNYQLYYTGSTFIKLRGTVFELPTTASVYIQNTASPDGGDHSVSDCMFSADNTTSAVCIMYRSSGGLKIANSKFLGADRQVVLDPLNGIATANLQIIGCSSEAAKTAHFVFARSSGTGTFKQVIVEGCQFDPINPSGKTLITVGNGIQRAMIVGNMMVGGSGTIGVSIAGTADSVLVANNQFTGVQTAVQQASTATNVSIPTGNQYIGVTNNLVNV